MTRPRSLPAANKWIAGLDKTDPAYEHHVTEALWVHQWMNVVDEDAAQARAALARAARPRRRHARALLLARPRRRRAGPAEGAGGGRKPARAAGSRPRRQLLQRLRGGGCRPGRAEPADRLLHRLHAQRDDEAAGADLAQGRRQRPARSAPTTPPASITSSTTSAPPSC